MEKTKTQDREQGKAITHAVALIEKQFGKGSIMRLDESPNAGDIEVISTGSLSLDLALGVGGVPRGRIIEIFGPESSGKTTLTLHIAAEAQKAGGVVAFVDAEHALDVGYSKKIGVDPKALIVSQPDHGEQALEIVDMLVSSGKVDLVIVDSVAALTPKIEIEGEMSDQQVLEYLAGNTFDPVSAPRTAFAQTFAWLLAEKPDFGMSPCWEASPSTWTSASALEDMS